MKRSLAVFLFAAICSHAAQPESTSGTESVAARQRAAAQVQLPGDPGNSFFTTAWSGEPLIPAPPAAPDCPASPEREFDTLIRDSASRYHLNPDLIRAVIRQESGFRPCAVSGKGAMGLMQIMPATADLFKVQDPFDPAQNIEAGSAYLSKLLARFQGDLSLALASYNAGPEKVDGAVPAVPNIPETRDYVARIIAALHGAPAETANRPKN